MAGATTRDQERAKHAWAKVQLAQDKSDFAKRAKKLPVLIRTCGLGQAVAFVNADAKRGETVLKAVESWVDKAIPQAGRNQSLLDRIVHGDSMFLRRATDESLAYLFWLVRFAEANEK